MAKESVKKCNISAINDACYSPEIMSHDIPFSEFDSALFIGKGASGEFRFWYSNCSIEKLCSMEKALSLFIQQLMTD